MATITDFIGRFQYAGARPYLFRFSVGSWPTAVTSAPAGETIEYQCKSAIIPTSQISTIEIPYLGRKIKVPGTRTFDDLTVTFFNDEDFAVHTGLTQWSAAMAQHNEVFGNQVDISSDEASIAKSVYVRQYSKSRAGGAEILLREYEFVKAFPINVSEISLDWENGDAVEEFTVTWAYQYWRISNSTSPAVEAGDLLTSQ